MLTQSLSVRAALGLPALVLAAALAACGGQDRDGEFYTDWDLAGGCSNDEGIADRLDAEDNAVDVCAAEGRWVWVSYAAAWCSTSRKQAPVLSRLTRSPPQDALLYAVLTNGDEVFTPATRRDAQAWAGTDGFDRQRVLRDAEPGNRTLPQRLLIGPDGRTWYRYIGYLEAAEIASLLEDFAHGARSPDVRDLGAR